MSEQFIVSIEKLRASCDPATLSFQTTHDLDSPDRMVGHNRAYDALEFGLGEQDSRYNVFVAGPSGTGKSFATQAFAKEIAETMPVPDDWCYVYNFANPYVPNALALPPGHGKTLARDVDMLIESVRQALSETFESSIYRKRREAALHDLEERQKLIQSKFEEIALEHHFIVQVEENEPNFIPVRIIAPEVPTVEQITNALANMTNDNKNSANPLPPVLPEEALPTISEPVEPAETTLATEQTELPAAEEETPAGDTPKTAINGTPQPISKEQFEELNKEEKEFYDTEFIIVREAFAEARSQVRILMLEVRQIVKELDTEVAKETIAPLFQKLEESYQELPNVVAYFQTMQDDIVSSPEALTERDDGNEESGGGDSTANMIAAMAGRTKSNDRFLRYKVNVIVDRSGQKHAPCIVESNPTYYNLIGRLEYSSRMGNLYTDFTFLKAGSLQQANGGFLIINVRELITSPRAWDGLKRSIKNGIVAIENLPDPQQMTAPTASLKPDPIPLKIKIILMGDWDDWQLLNTNDPDFAQFFKVRADFSPEMPRNNKTEMHYARFLGDVARELRLPPMDRGAVARIIEEGSRMVESQRKLSTSFTQLRDLVIESSHWAKRTKSDVVTASHVEQAIMNRRNRTRLFGEMYEDQVRQGLIMISTTGSTIGQVNALSISEVLGRALGQPMRLTARTAPGAEGLVAIERESMMTGPIFTKSVYTLAGYVAGEYAQDIPLSMTATISFEQIYVAIEGDSASLAELCALLSALSNTPVKQGIAITGSVNQWGDVQAVGGVTTKIEGFFDICQLQGASRENGVIIPASNVQTLMLRPDIIQAVKSGFFTIYAVKNIAEAMFLLSGRELGQRDATGAFPGGTIGFDVSHRLRDYAHRLREFHSNR